MPSRISERVGDRDSPRSEHKERRRHHRPKRAKDGTPAGETPDDQDEIINTERTSSATTDPSTPQRKSSMPVPELQRRCDPVSPNASRTSLPYPSFSKAHSREAVSSKDNLATPPRKNIFTPDPTDLQQRDSPKNDIARNVPTMNGPPSPPLTADDHAAPFEGKRQGSESQTREIRRNPSDAKLSKEDLTGQITTEKKSPYSANASPLRPLKVRTGSSTSSLRQARSATPSKRRPKPVTINEGSTILSERRRSRSTSPASSSKTSIAPQQHKVQTPFSPDADDEASPNPDTAASPRTPTLRGTPVYAAQRQASVQPPNGVKGAGGANGQSPMPPPPPPPPAVNIQPPRVDYLMLNGGLLHAAPKHFLAAPEPGRQSEFVIGELPDPTTTSAQVQRFFSPFSKILEDYSKVMTKNGSIAVATGYRSIARRLLDRLEAVFARDISSEECDCVMCEASAEDLESQADTGVNWGEVLEYVSGRQELPQWPPFVFSQQDVGLGILSEEYKAPMQKLDIDVPEEYREHYIRQSKKTKQTIDRWLSRQTVDVEEPPDEADDDTLTFAVLTHLEDHERPLFSQILGVSASRPPSIHPSSRTQTPLNAPRSPLLTQTGLALQRLYRLPNLPRSPECALFLVKNQSIHNVLATLAAISDGEWDILTSGRFDGFLRSGAEDVFGPQPTPSRGPSAPPSRSVSGSVPPPTPSGAASGAPVALDEETEIAALAEVEREIFLGMESLEDAFEALHVQAEMVRRALRERGAGLLMAAQARKGAGAAAVEARLGTPASATGASGNGWENETDDGFDDGVSELAPDDSASNVSRSRYRRPKRRTERRTPAPVEEESDDMAAPIPTKPALGTARASWSRNSLRKR